MQSRIACSDSFDNDAHPNHLQIIYLTLFHFVLHSRILQDPIQSPSLRNHLLLRCYALQCMPSTICHPAIHSLLFASFLTSRSSPLRLIQAIEMKTEWRDRLKPNASSKAFCRHHSAIRTLPTLEMHESHTNRIPNPIFRNGRRTPPRRKELVIETRQTALHPTPLQPTPHEISLSLRFVRHVH